MTIPQTGIYFAAEPAWYLIILILVIIWLVLMYYRRVYGMRSQIIVACIVTFLAFGMENIAVFYGIWDYAGGNWPVTLWIAYFVAALMTYQLVRFVDDWMSKTKTKK